MTPLTEFIFLSVLGSIFTILFSSPWRPWLTKRLSQHTVPFFSLFKGFTLSGPVLAGSTGNHHTTEALNRHKLDTIHDLSDCHEVASSFSALVKQDGAGSWPPKSNHNERTWPAILQAYKEIYHEMAPLLPAENVSLDDTVNEQRIVEFRSRFAQLLTQKVDLAGVEKLLRAADSGRWDIFPKDVYNGFYCCLAWCRHAYRWASIPVVRLAQLEKSIALPEELVVPWNSMQSHFGLDSESGNNMSNLVLNFNTAGDYALKINTGLSSLVQSSEEEFARIFHEVEVLGVPIYSSIIEGIVAHARGDKESCLEHVRDIRDQLRPLLSSYYDRVHDARIARSVWLSRVQGFYAWGVGHQNSTNGEWEKFDGLSGNQVLLFQALDAFLGLEAYLPKVIQERNVPVLQRRFCEVVKRHGFRSELGNEGIDGKIKREFEDIVKRLRVFRSAHRTRAKVYLTQPAPERLPMTAGKSLLKEDMEQSLVFLDQFMVGRLLQTV
ncbi:hypothetical protein QBC40DRAFT_310917 [Triangularia verruculosa]|uniref:Indoleamine 2,3-dioxygenase n=1 Tax=Triangularia verruculosa TaxID=2587418 RepID=A0AAN6X982_9PEZI|nr:hypothetical protein QBC40DRAFT_310917 [Triangularia verruculosa]